MGLFSSRRSTSNTSNFTTNHDDDTQQTATSSSFGASVNVQGGGTVNISDAGAIAGNTAIANRALDTADRIDQRAKEVQLFSISEQGNTTRHALDTVSLNNIASNELIKETQREAVTAIKEANAQIASAHSRASARISSNNSQTLEAVKEFSAATSESVKNSTDKIGETVRALSGKFTDALKDIKETELTDGNSLIINAVKYWPVIGVGAVALVAGASALSKKSKGSS